MEPASVVSWTSFSSVITAMQSQISVTTVVGVLAAVAGVAVGLVFMWWGVRKGTRALMSAFRRGRLSV